MDSDVLDIGKRLWQQSAKGPFTSWWSEGPFCTLLPKTFADVCTTSQTIASLRSSPI